MELEEQVCPGKAILCSFPPFPVQSHFAISLCAFCWLNGYTYSCSFALNQCQQNASVAAVRFPSDTLLGKQWCRGIITILVNPTRRRKRKKNLKKMFWTEQNKRKRGVIGLNDVTRWFLGLGKCAVCSIEYYFWSLVDGGWISCSSSCVVVVSSSWTNKLNYILNWQRKRSKSGRQGEDLLTNICTVQIKEVQLKDEEQLLVDWSITKDATRKTEIVTSEFSSMSILNVWANSRRKWIKYRVQQTVRTEEWKRHKPGPPRRDELTVSPSSIIFFFHISYTKCFFFSPCEWNNFEL